ncbi:hypothetical protein GCM10027200_23690 [Lentzea nigeriaca]
MDPALVDGRAGSSVAFVLVDAQRSHQESYTAASSRLKGGASDMSNFCVSVVITAQNLISGRLEDLLHRSLAAPPSKKTLKFVHLA